MQRDLYYQRKEIRNNNPLKNTYDPAQ